jgi:hypothetical protein
MPDLQNRDDWESKLARLMGRYFGERLSDLIDELGDPPNLNNVSQEWWDSLNDVQVPLEDLLREIALESAERMLDTQPIGVDWALVNRRAAREAREHGGQLITRINDTTRRDVNDVIAQAFEDDLSVRQIRDRLAQTFGPRRAELIAVTEVTGASVRGELAFAEQLRQEGVQMVATWVTNRDDLVCPQCGPLDGKVRGDGWQEPPPKHPRCRCWLIYEAQIENG